MKRKTVVLISVLMLALIFAGCAEDGRQPSAQDETAFGGETQQLASAWKIYEDVNISAVYLDNIPNPPASAVRYTEVTENKDELVGIVFNTNRTVRDFSCIELNLDEEGLFEVGETYFQITEFKPEDTVIFKITFPGDMPTRGVSYTDKDGLVHRFYIAMSGKDGSLEFGGFENPSDIPY